MSSDLQLLIRIRADINQALTELRQVSGELKKTGKSGQDAGDGLDKAGNEAKKADSAFGELKRTLVGLFAIEKVREFGRSLVETNVELQRIHFTLVAATGSAQAANEQFAFVERTSRALGLNLQVTAAGYARLAASAHSANVPLKQQQDLFTALARVSSVMHLSNQDTQSALLALEQMLSKGNVQAQELRLQLGQAIPGVLENFTHELHITGAQLESMLQNGELATNKVLPALINALNDSAPQNALQGAVQGTNAALHDMSTAFFELRTSMGEGGFIQIVTVGARNLAEMARIFANTSAQTEHLGQEFAWVGTVLRIGVGGPVAFVKMGFQELGNAIGTVAAQIAEVFRSIANHNFSGLESRLKAIGTAGDEQFKSILKNYESTLQKLSQPPKPIPLPKVTHYDTSHIKHELTAAAVQQQTLNKQARDAANAEKARKTSIEGIIASLKQQSSTYGETSQQIAIYRLRTLGATDAQIKEAQALVTNIEKQDAAKKALKAKADEEKKAAEAAKQHAQQLHQDAERIKDMLDPMRQYHRELVRLREEYQAGELTSAQYQAAIAKIGQEMKRTADQANKSSNQMNQFAIQAARNIQDVLANALETGFKGGLKGMVDAFGQAMQKMAAQAAAADLAKRMFGNYGKTGQIGGWAGMIGQFAAQFFHDGGDVGAGGRTASVPAYVFAGAPRMHTGGWPGLAADEVPAILQKGERVLSRRELARGMGAGQQTVIQNIQTPDLRSFQRASGQLYSDAAAQMGRASRRYS